jgi:hypothetical protein
MITNLILELPKLVCSGTISGTVISDEGLAVGAVLKFSTSNNKISFSENKIVTDSSGHFKVDATIEPNTPAGSTETINITLDNNGRFFTVSVMVEINCPPLP